VRTEADGTFTAIGLPIGEVNVEAGAILVLKGAMVKIN